jgi:hypothetical protein
LNASTRKVCVALALSAMATVLLTACGGDSDSTPTESSTAQESGTALDPTAPMSEQLAQTFPEPKPAPGSPPGTAAAIAAGREACKGMTPLEVREEFIVAAEARGGLTDGQREMVGELDKYEKQASQSPSFAAGQLAAGVYEATLPEKQRIAGYQGCVYELALQLRRELSKQKG